MVIGIIVLLVTIVVLGAQKVVSLSRAAKDLGQQRGIALAQSAYATDNNDAFASCRTTGFNPPGRPYAEIQFLVTIGSVTQTVLLNNGQLDADRYHLWVRAYDPHLTTGVVKKELESAVTTGALFPYIGALGNYRSPNDPTDRVRSYSLNAFVGVTVPDDESSLTTRWASWMACNELSLGDFNTTRRSRIREPSRTIMSIVEDDTERGTNPRQHNLHGWVVDPRAPVGTPNQACTAGDWQGWIDWPAFWEVGYITYSYVDGSTESYQMVNPNVERAIVGPPYPGAGHDYAQPPDSPGSPFREDWMHFRERLLPGVIPPIINRSLIPQS